MAHKAGSVDLVDLHLVHLVDLRDRQDRQDNVIGLDLGFLLPLVLLSLLVPRRRSLAPLCWHCRCFQRLQCMDLMDLAHRRALPKLVELVRLCRLCLAPTPLRRAPRRRPQSAMRFRADCNVRPECTADCIAESMKTRKSCSS